MREAEVRQFWAASLAWARHPTFVKGMTVEKLFDILRPLESSTSQTVSTQASQLARQIVMGNLRRRKRRAKKSNIVAFPIHLTTNNAIPLAKEA